MDSMNDEEDGDFINSEDNQSQPRVRVASLEKLVDYCAEEFSRDVPDPFLSNAVFMTHKWFISSEELLRKFIQRYSNHSALNNEHIRKFKRSICSAVGFWISGYGSDFKKDEQLTSLLTEFQKSVECEEERTIIHLSNLCAEEIRNRALSGLTGTEHPPLDQRKSSLAFRDISANTIAEQLTYLEYRMLRRIPFSEWKTYVCTGKLGETTYLERYVALFNGLSRWVQAMVLNCVTPQERASCIEKFQQAAKHLKELQNFNGLMAVAGGLTNSVLSRLRQTQELLSQDCREYLKLLMEFLSSNGNYASYRKTLNSCTGFCIPILGIQLKDLIALHTALPDTMEGNLLNVQKMIRLSKIMSRLLQAQTSPPALQPNLELIKMLRVSLQPRLTDEELYELSLAREPRMHSRSSCASLGSVESSGEQYVMFADWAAGLLDTTPDPVTSEKHVASMVEAVFKLYDTNKDGSISTEEFDAIATNFPFIDSFGVLDVNSDGVISREEMKNYFIKAHCHELSKGFSHTFQETTYFTPTFCDYCAGMLWGIIKQGYRCKVCHINCHKNCKGEIVRGCRPKSSNQLNGVDKSPYKVDSLRIAKWKNKMKLHKQFSEESLKSLNGECVSVPVDQYKQLLRAQQANEAILAENVRLHKDLQDATHKLGLLQNHLNSLRQNTVTFILDQMDALHIQKDTEV